MYLFAYTSSLGLLCQIEATMFLCTFSARLIHFHPFLPWFSPLCWSKKQLVGCRQVYHLGRVILREDHKVLPVARSDERAKSRSWELSASWILFSKIWFSIFGSISSISYIFLGKSCWPFLVTLRSKSKTGSSRCFYGKVVYNEWQLPLERGDLWSHHWQR